MAQAETKLPAHQRIDFVSIVTPNFAHFPAARTFLQAGFNVVCDKPMTLNLDEALELREVVRKSGKVFALTHNYTGYPMVKEARELVNSGEIGKIPENRGGVSPRLAAEPHRSGRPKTGLLAHGSRTCGSKRLHW